MSEKKSSVYTKTGDKGYTSLVGGQRVHKSDHAIDKYGEIDELNSVVGFLIASLKDNHQLSSNIACLKYIQSRLFDLGSNLACFAEQRIQFKLPKLESDVILFLEKEIDKLDKDLKPLKNFILPGGTIPASIAHLARAVCRRAERSIAKGDLDLLPENSLEFINRLSDYFFILARHLNSTEGISEELW